MQEQFHRGQSDSGHFDPLESILGYGELCFGVSVDLMSFLSRYPHNLYTISIDDMMKSSPICLLSKASKYKSWLWHRRLNHLNFGTINDLARKDLVGLNKTVRYIRTDNGTEFVNQVMSEYYEGVGIFHQKSVPRTPQLYGVIKSGGTKSLVHDKKPDLTFLRVFGALCYPTNDSEDLGKFQAKADIGIFVGYAPSRKGYRIYNKRTRRLMETIHVTFDEMHHDNGSCCSTIKLRAGDAIYPIVSPHGTSLSTTIAHDAVTTCLHRNIRYASFVHIKVLQMNHSSRHHQFTHDILHPTFNHVTGDPGSVQSSSGE
ncbi:integrase, catalytic region, zinc finger, CCHC-type containing protein [Tanacetum coccineum]